EDLPAPQGGAAKTLPRLFEPARQLEFLLPCQQGDGAHLPQVESQRVVGAVDVGFRRRLRRFFRRILVVFVFGRFRIGLGRRVVGQTWGVAPGIEPQVVQRPPLLGQRGRGQSGSHFPSLERASHV